MSWTQPVCVPCWNRDHPDRQMSGAHETGDLAHCCECGSETRSGIYIRIDPATVPFPQQD